MKSASQCLRCAMVNALPRYLYRKNAILPPAVACQLNYQVFLILCLILTRTNHDYKWEKFQIKICIALRPETYFSLGP